MTRTQTFGLIALLVLLALFALPMANATLVVNKYTNDFSASSPYNEQLKLCACETKVDRIVVENTGDFIADFNVRVDTDYPRSIRIPEANFQIGPKHFQEALIYIEDSCGLQGVYHYDVTVTNSYGRAQTISRSIRIDACQTTLLDVTPVQATVGLCQPGTFKVNVTNVGTFADTFTLDFGQYTPASTVHEMYLQPGQSLAQDVSFQFACTDFGTKTIPFIALTGKNVMGAQTWRDMTVTNDYEYALGMPTSIDVCAKTATQVPITLTNAIDVPDDLQLRLNAPSFVSMPATAHLEGKEQKNITLILNPPKGSEGSYKLSISAVDVYGGMRKDRDLTLDVSDCYAPAVEIRDAPDHALTAPLQACCGPKTFSVNVRNDGDREQVFDLSVDGPSLFVLDETSVRVAPHQNVNVPLRANLPCTDERYTADVTVMPQGQPQVNATARIVIDSQTQRTCHMVQIDDDEIAMRDGTLVQPVMVKQTGSEGGTYTISTNSTLFTFQEENISLAPGDQRAIHMVPKYNLSTQERGRYVVQPMLTLLEPDLGIAYKEHVGVRLTEKGFFERIYDWFIGLPWGALGVCGWVIIILCIALVCLVVFLLLIYAGKIASGDGLTRWTLTLLKTALLALIVILLLAMLLLRSPNAEMRYERVAGSTDSTIIEWYQNDDKTIDMSQYFTDPDKDYLSYTVTQPRDIKADIVGNMLTLSPDHNFVGENTMVITASDSKGGVTDSPVFVLRVIPEKHIGFIAWLQLWCHYIVLLLCVLILLVLFLIVLTIKEIRQDLKKDHVLVIVDRKDAGSASARRRTTRRPARRIITPLPLKRVAKAAPKKAAVKRAPAKKASTKAAPAKKQKIVVKTRRPGRGVTIRETKEGGKMVNIEVNAPAQPAQQQGPMIVTVPGAKPSEIVYIGSKGGNTVHTPYCMVARRIPRNKRVAYSTKKEAINAGLVPCRMCRPFEGGI